MRSFTWYRKVFVVAALALATTGTSGCRSGGAWTMPGSSWWSSNKDKADADALARREGPSKPSTSLPSPSSTMTPPGATQTAANNRPNSATGSGVPSGYGSYANNTNSATGARPTGTGTTYPNTGSTAYNRGTYPNQPASATAPPTSGNGIAGYNNTSTGAPGGAATGGAGASGGYNAQGFYPNTYPNSTGATATSTGRGVTYSANDDDSAPSGYGNGGGYGNTGGAAYTADSRSGGYSNTYPSTGGTNYDAAPSGARGSYPVAGDDGYESGGYTNAAPSGAGAGQYRPGSTRDGDDSALTNGVQPANYSAGGGYGNNTSNYPSNGASAGGSAYPSTGAEAPAAAPAKSSTYGPQPYSGSGYNNSSPNYGGASASSPAAGYGSYPSTATKPSAAAAPSASDPSYGASYPGEYK